MLRDQMRSHLTGKILPFWEGLKDTSFGGYYGFVDKELNVAPDADKGCILNSRILWTFSTAARALGDHALRAYADHAYDFFRRFEDQENGGVYWSVTHDGRPSDRTNHT